FARRTEISGLAISAQFVNSDSRPIILAHIEFPRQAPDALGTDLLPTALFQSDVDTHLNTRSIERQAPAISPDGYIRLRLADLNALHFVHLFSESDTDFLEELVAQTVPARSAGFSEWRTNTNPAISLGWGWFIHEQSERILLAPDAVRSNVMLIDFLGYDLGPLKTSSLFCSWLSVFEWQKTVGLTLRAESTVPC
ncbi:MAG: DUF4902 domain-containing protein, partial [Noviherbaspirillum sp.]